MDGEVDYVMLDKRYKIIYNAPFQIKCMWWMDSRLSDIQSAYMIIPGYEFAKTYTQIKIENNVIYAKCINTTSGVSFSGLLVMIG